MRLDRALMLPVLLALAVSARAQPAADPLDQPVEATSEPVPDGVRAVSPDSLTTHAQSPDADDADAVSPDALLTGAGEEIQGHAQSPDSLTTHSYDAADLPAASAIDQAPAAIAPAMPLAPACARPAGDADWSACLSATNDALTRARARLDAANAAYSRSITSHVPAGEERRQIIEERDAAHAEVSATQSALASQVSQAQQAGASSWVTAPYRPQDPGW